jgi:hypothetical protein
VSSLFDPSRGPTPVIIQSEAAECGLACLAMVASYHGFQIDLASLRRRHCISLKGSTLAQLMQVAASLNLAARPLKVELEKLGMLAVPGTRRRRRDPRSCARRVSSEAICGFKAFYRRRARTRSDGGIQAARGAEPNNAAGSAGV